MSGDEENRFDTIESAHQYLGVLGEVLTETQGAIRHDIEVAHAGPTTTRHVDALQLVDYKLERLRNHVEAGRRLLNDLRTLRRLLHGERPAPALTAPSGEPIPTA